MLPGPGEGVHAEALTTVGAEVLVINQHEDGTVVLEDVGSDAEADLNPDPTVDFRAKSPSECQDTAFSQREWRLYGDEGWRFNRGTTPNEIGVAAAEDDLRQAGTNIASVRNNCGLGDGVGPGMSFSGDTDRGTGIDSGGRCDVYDGFSVTAFGDLPATSEKRTLGVACQNWFERPDAWDELIESNVKLNKVEATWTTNPTSDACRNRYGVETVMTHERGHTFGLGHVSEDGHAHQTMSTLINGPCQASETTLGGGDVRGLNSKYP